MSVTGDLMKWACVTAQLVPFFKAVCMYFALDVDAPSAATAALKCAPIICLLGCVLFKAAFTAGEWGRYAWFVSLGLALSALGDVALVWPQMLAGGIILFGAAHISYIAAFGLRPRRAGLGALAALAAALYVRTLRPAALKPFTFLVHVYAALLAAMAWRGAARPGPQRAGALLFALSDGLLGYSLFGGSLPYKNVLVMSTYYLGQLLIALSALLPMEALRLAE
ncbi:PREDICTED: lysoplasmalogenase isoform X2 [Papilio polytes]|uniref:lysoplasmalogenase isoform X2 n=1 Tax=Papilio polytes TaxID=76194 RepID=UPI000675C52D|nr:PREDICTED: lysoplasmalogenase isoform X2 [Papilio polytes]